jgi:hypothetical protein
VSENNSKAREWAETGALLLVLLLSVAGGGVGRRKAPTPSPHARQRGSVGGCRHHPDCLPP